MPKLKIKLHESHGSMKVWAVTFDSEDQASEEDYYLRDGWGSELNTAVSGNVLYVDGDKAEKILKDWFPGREIQVVAAPRDVEQMLLGNYTESLEESKKKEDAAWEPTVKKIKDLKKDEFFTLKPIEYPKESQVWVFDGYDRSDRTYCAIKFSDIGDSRCFKGDKEVYTGFTF
jgi:hypothetical protein